MKPSARTEFRPEWEKKTNLEPSKSDTKCPCRHYFTFWEITYELNLNLMTFWVRSGEIALGIGGHLGASGETSAKCKASNTYCNISGPGLLSTAFDL